MVAGAVIARKLQGGSRAVPQGHSQAQKERKNLTGAGLRRWQQRFAPEKALSHDPDRPLPAHAENKPKAQPRMPPYSGRHAEDKAQ